MYIVFYWVKLAELYLNCMYYSSHIFYVKYSFCDYCPVVLIYLHSLISWFFQDIKIDYKTVMIQNNLHDSLCHYLSNLKLVIAAGLEIFMVAGAYTSSFCEELVILSLS